jgi:hypothetical protein
MVIAHGSQFGPTALERIAHSAVLARRPSVWRNDRKAHRACALCHRQTLKQKLKGVFGGTHIFEGVPSSIFLIGGPGQPRGGVRSDP